MSEQKSKLGVLLLQEVFGDVVGSIGSHLTSNSQVMLHEVSDKPRAAEAFAVLIQHHCLAFEESKRRRGLFKYSIDLNQVLNLLKYPRYLFIAKNILGDTAELLLEEMLKSGKLTATEMVFRTLKRLPPSSSEVDSKELHRVLCDAAEKQFISRVQLPDLGSNEDNHTASKVGEDVYHKPVVMFETIKNATDNGSNKLTKGVDTVQWKPNFSRFHEELRNQVIVSSVTRRIDASAGVLVGIILNLMRKSSCVSMIDISEQVDSCKDGNLIRFKDQYIKVLEEDRTRFLDKVGNEGGGTYTVSLKNISGQLAAAVIENIVMEKFSSKALRIFR